ncbi:hypothetical protein QYF61_023075, partial [Mycteria americana]
MCRTLPLALLDLMRFTWAHFSSLSRSLWMAFRPSGVNRTAQLGVICKLAEGALDPTVYVIDEDIEQHWSQYRSLRDMTWSIHSCTGDLVLRRLRRSVGSQLIPSAVGSNGQNELDNKAILQRTALFCVFPKGLRGTGSGGETSSPESQEGVLRVSISPLYVLLGQVCEGSRTSTSTIKSGRSLRAPKRCTNPAQALQAPAPSRHRLRVGQERETKTEEALVCVKPKQQLLSWLPRCRCFLPALPGVRLSSQTPRLQPS